MENRDKMFIWSANWWLEDDRAWFVDWMSNILFNIDLNTGECEDAIYIPDSEQCTYRLTPFCLKYDRDIFCIPGRSQSIWIYHLDSKTFSKIEIDKPDQSQPWLWKDAIFIVSPNWNRIIEVGISQEAIKNCYTICEEDTVRRSVLAGGSIYMVSSKFSQVYRFDLTTKEMETYVFSEVEKKLLTICFDGKRFWLSGYQRELYIWDKENNRFTIIDSFPQDFGMYVLDNDADVKVDCLSSNYENPLFSHVVAVGDYIWFIPCDANKVIYVNKESAILSAFDICGEEETKESFLLRKSQGVARYLLEYVRNDRYIALFSVKSRRILEIDTKELQYQWKEYYFSDECVRQCSVFNRGTYFEEDILCRNIYDKRIQSESDSMVDRGSRNMGAHIYKTLVGEEDI